ncbi:MAG TPA: hypothetical protein PLS46_13340, partial [Microthrixaceae bacterium]|nr:hypothetical protein [Microthrixaceae bacterium]
MGAVPAAHRSQEAPDVSLSPSSFSSIDEFRQHVAALVERPGWTAPAAFGLGIATISEVGDGTKVLDTYFPFPNRDENVGF